MRAPSRFPRLAALTSAFALVAGITATAASAETVVTHDTITLGSFPAQCGGVPIVGGEATFTDVVTTNLTPSGRFLFSFLSSGHARYVDEAGNEFIQQGTTRDFQVFDLDADSAAHNTAVLVVRDIQLRGSDVGGNFMIRSLFSITLDPSGQVTEIQIRNEFICD